MVYVFVCVENTQNCPQEHMWCDTTALCPLCGWQPLYVYDILSDHKIKSITGLVIPVPSRIVFLASQTKISLNHMCLFTTLPPPPPPPPKHWGTLEANTGCFVWRRMVLLPTIILSDWSDECSIFWVYNLYHLVVMFCLPRLGQSKYSTYV